MGCGVGAPQGDPWEKRGLNLGGATPVQPGLGTCTRELWGFLLLFFLFLIEMKFNSLAFNTFTVFHKRHCCLVLKHF